VARVAEASQQIDRPTDCHFTQFDEALVRLQIGVQDFSGNIFGTVDHRLCGYRPHTQLRIKADQARNVGFIVLERINVTFGGLIDEISVKDLAAALFVRNPLDAKSGSDDYWVWLRL
jgi:hypothetical protein